MANERNPFDITSAEFYEKYCLVNGKAPTLTDLDREFFDIIDKAQKEGKEIMIVHRTSWRRR